MVAEKLKDAVRTARFEIYRIESGDPKEVRQRWWHLCDVTRQVTNCAWRTWLLWHVQNRSAGKIRKHLDRLAKWRETKAGEKPKCEVVALPKECQKAMYDELAITFPDIATTSREFVRNVINGKIKNRKAAKGNLSGWMAILLCHENLPSTTRPIPIPFPAKSAEIVPPMKESDNFRVRVRIDRQPIDGKKIGKSTVDEFQLLTKRRGIAAYEKLLYRMVTGEIKFCNASLLWNNKQKKWFCLIGYRMPATGQQAEGDGTAILYPNDSEANAPWTIEINGRKSWRGAHRARDVEHRRRHLLTQRWARQDNYRFAGSANKGHGRDRAMGPIFQLSQAWKDFVKTHNQHTAKRAVEDCLLNDCATLIFRQPVGANRDKMMLSTAGKIDGRHDSTNWDWGQLASMLGHKCQQAGIHLIVEKVGDEDAEAA